MTEDGGNEPRFGTVALIGRPNVGKSTLINALVGQPLSIVTHKPQTTRHRILGIVSREEGQVLFVDTPGVHAGECRAINRYMNRAAKGALEGVDAVVCVFDANRWTAGDDRILTMVARCDAPRLAALNKIDRMHSRERLLPLMESLGKRDLFRHIVPVSAKTGDGLDELMQAVLGELPTGEPVFDPELFTDASMRFLAAELIREQLILRLHQEVPYRLAVEIENFEEGPKRFRIGAVIWVEQPGQKAMVIGRRGEMLKTVGTRARQAMGRLFERPVHLDLWVKVKKDWSDDERALRQLGYDD